MKKDTDVLARLKEKANIFNYKRYKKVRTPSRLMRRRFSFKIFYTFAYFFRHAGPVDGGAVFLYTSVVTLFGIFFKKEALICTGQRNGFPAHPDLAKPDLLLSEKHYAKPGLLLSEKHYAKSDLLLPEKALRKNAIFCRMKKN